MLQSALGDYSLPIRGNIECPDLAVSDEAQQIRRLSIAKRTGSIPPRARNDRADPYSIFHLRPSNGGMKPVSNRNGTTSVADAVEAAPCHKTP
jgi:hypothetical protein